MFEKEAEEYAEGMAKYYESAHGSIPSQFEKYLRKAVEYGYNKANEWHFVKDELPELYKDVLVVFPSGDCDVKRLTNHNEWVGRGSWCSLTDVIAWKEIVLPELKESK